MSSWSKGAKTSGRRFLGQKKRAPVPIGREKEGPQADPSPIALVQNFGVKEKKKKRGTSCPVCPFDRLVLAQAPLNGDFDSSARERREKQSHQWIRAAEMGESSKTNKEKNEAKEPRCVLG